MTLNPRSKYPSARSYVLKLHRDAAPLSGRLAGRLEHMSSGRHFEFGSAEELLACLKLDPDSIADEPPADGGGTES